MKGLLILIVVALVALGPLAFIWALNTLFGLGIAYNFWTWLAVIVFLMFLRAPLSKE